MRNNHGQCANLMMMMVMVFDVAEWKCTIGAGAQGAHLLWQLWEESESGSDSCGGWVYWTNSLKMSFLVEFLINSTLLESDDSGGRINFSWVYWTVCWTDFWAFYEHCVLCRCAGCSLWPVEQEGDSCGQREGWKRSQESATSEERIRVMATMSQAEND